MKKYKKILSIVLSLLICLSIGCGNVCKPSTTESNGKTLNGSNKNTNITTSKIENKEDSIESKENSNKVPSTDTNDKRTTSIKSKDDNVKSKTNSKHKNESDNNKEKDNKFTLIISKELKGYTGKESIVIENKNVNISEKKNAMTYLRENASISEKGGFIYEINGIHNTYPIPSSQKTAEQKKLGIMGIDWFIYLNDEKTPVGANDIYPKKGDVLIFDFHEWDKREFVPPE